MTKTNWARTVPRLRKMAAELATFGFAVREPADLETRPRKPDQAVVIKPQRQL